MPYFPQDIDYSLTGTSQTDILIWQGTATTVSGVATFNPTDNNTGTGTALFSSILGTAPTASVNTATANSVPSCAIKLVSADLKTITVNAVQGTTVGALGGATSTFAPNGTSVTLTVFGVEA